MGNRSTARWFVEDRIIYVQNIGLLESASGDHKIHVVVACLAMEGIPALNELEGGRILKYLWKPRTGWTVVVDAKSNFMLKILSGILTGVAKAQFTMAKHLPESIHFLTKADDTLVDIPDINAWRQALDTDAA